MKGFACTHGKEAERCTVRFKGDLSHICHLSSTKKTHREKKMKKVKKAHSHKRKMSPGLDKKQRGNEQCGVRLLLSAERSKTLHSHSENDHSSQRAQRDNGKFHWYFRANFGNITRTSIIKMSSSAPQNT